MFKLKLTKGQGKINVEFHPVKMDSEYTDNNEPIYGGGVVKSYQVVLNDGIPAWLAEHNIPYAFDSLQYYEDSQGSVAKDDYGTIEFQTHSDLVFFTMRWGSL